MLDLRCVVFVAGLLLVGCGDNAMPDLDLPRSAPCVTYEALMVSVDDGDIVPSIVPAPAGIRIVVDASIQPFMGASYPVPGGRMVWSVWIFRWYDGDHTGAIGRSDGDMCRWYDPVI